VICREEVKSEEENDTELPRRERLPPLPTKLDEVPWFPSERQEGLAEFTAGNGNRKWC
jgi:hypothetical protein